MLLMNSGAAGADAGISPGDLGSIESWWRADTEVTGTSEITAWGDPISARDLTKEGSTGPVLTASDANFNGEPSVNFNGFASGGLSAAAQTQAQPLHMFMCMRQDSYTSADMMIILRSQAGVAHKSVVQQFGGTPEIRLSEDDQDPSFVSTTAIALDTTVLLICLFSGASNSSIAVNDGTPSTGDAGTNGFGSTQFVLGGKDGGSVGADFDVADLAFFNAALTGDDLAGVKQYYNNRYALGF